MSIIKTIGEHVFEIPEPKTKDDILFYDTKDPYWIREVALKDYSERNGIWYDFAPGKGGTKLYQDATLYDSDGNLVSLNKDDSDWIIRMYEREWQRRTYGVHFMNGKEITWLSGDYWFILAHCKTKRPDKKSEYFDYYEYQSEYLMLVWYVNNTAWIDGLDLSKAKKTGITNIHWLYYLNKSTMTKNLNLGNMNIDQNKGAKTFKDHFMYSFNGLPLPLKPGIKTKSEADGIITFGERATNSKRNSRQKGIADDELNTTVMCVATLMNAFDVDVFSDLWYDEPPKYKSDFGEIYRSNSEGTKLQDESAGKKWLTSYTPEGDSPSFKSAKELFFDSELRTINSDNDSKKTKSGIICHHIPAYASWKSEINKYGKCNEKESIKKILVRRNDLRDRARELQAEIRRYANDKREAWTAGGAGSVFDNVRLAEIHNSIEEEERNSILPPYQEGKLEWKNKLWEIGLKNRRPNGEFCPVEFIPITIEERKRGETGRLRIYNDIPDVQKNAILKNGRDEYGFIIPPELFNSFLGADPTQHAAASEVIEGSKNAYYVESAVDLRLDQLMRGVASGINTFEYFHRPELPNEAYEDLVKLIIYTSSLCAVEANVPTMATNLIEEGLGRFMLVKEKKEAGSNYRIWERWMGLPEESEKEYHLIRTSANSPETRVLLEYFVRLWISYIQRPVDGEKDYGATIKSKRTVDQMMNLDITDTRTSDLFMASGYCKFVRDQYSAILLSKKSKEYQGVSIQEMFKAFARA
jgi:hypothetical protein